VRDPLAWLLGLDRSPSRDIFFNLPGTVAAWRVRQVDLIRPAYLGGDARFDPGTTIADPDLSVRSTEGLKRQWLRVAEGGRALIVHLIDFEDRMRHVATRGVAPIPKDVSKA
jgi:hypothetical protein